MTSLRVTGLDGQPHLLSHEAIAALADPGDTVRVARLLDAVAAPSSATHCTAISEGGAYRASIPIDEIRRGGILEIRRDGRDLGSDEGGPYRLRVLDGATLCWNVKAVEELRMSTDALPDDVPANPTH